MVKYRKTTSIINIENENHTIYGIEVTENGKVIDKIEDVSVDEKAVDKLVSDCNTFNLAPEHLRDIVEDFLVTA